jgi:hypothetical protein
MSEETMSDYELGARQVWETLSCACHWQKWNTRKITSPDRRRVCTLTRACHDCKYENCLARAKGDVTR